MGAARYPHYRRAKAGCLAGCRRPLPRDGGGAGPLRAGRRIDPHDAPLAPRLPRRATLPVAAAGVALRRELSPAAAAILDLDVQRPRVTVRRPHKAPQRDAPVRLLRDHERQAEAVPGRLRGAILVVEETRLELAVRAGLLRVVTQQVLRERLHAGVAPGHLLADRAEVRLRRRRHAEVSVR